MSEPKTAEVKVVPCGWRTMESAPKDRTPVRALIHADLYPRVKPGRDDLVRWNGQEIVVHHPGIADDGFDTGWSLSAPVGHGGFPDEWFVGWLPTGLAASPPAETGEGVGVGLVKVTIFCPNCSVPHVDEGEWTTRPHKTHQCQSCGEEWRPFPFSTVGIAHPASDQSDTERMRADDCSRFVFVEALAKTTFAQMYGATAWRLANAALRQQWISRTQDAIQSARAALAEKAADK